MSGAMKAAAVGHRALRLKVKSSRSQSSAPHELSCTLLFCWSINLIADEKPQPPRPAIQGKDEPPEQLTDPLPYTLGRSRSDSDLP